MDEKYELWLPFYVNGTLPAGDRAEMDRYLAANPSAKSDVAFFERMAISGKAPMERIPVDIGLRKAIEKNRTSSPSQIKRSAALSTDAPDLFSRLRDWFGTSWVQPAFAAALVVIGVQTSLLMQAPSEPQMRGGGAPAAASPVNGSFIRVSFHPSATEGEIRVLLGAANAHFVSGPDASGGYIVVVAPNEAARMLDALRASRAVATANPTAEAK